MIGTAENLCRQVRKVRAAMISATAGELRRIAAEDILSACELVAEDAPTGFHEEVASRLLTFRGATVAEVES